MVVRLQPYSLVEAWTDFSNKNQVDKNCDIFGVWAQRFWCTFWGPFVDHLAAVGVKH